MASMVCQLCLFLVVLVTMINQGETCAAFVNGPWAQANKKYWRSQEMSPTCLGEWQSRGGVATTFKGFFVQPAGASDDQQEELDGMIIFRRHCLNYCTSPTIVGGNGNPSSGTINIEQGVGYQDSPLPELVTLKCICQGGAISPTVDVRQLHAEYMLNCHFSSMSTLPPTTLTSGTDPTPATTQDPNKANGDHANYLGCFYDSPYNRTLKGAYQRIELNGKWACARYCHQFGFTHFGLEYYTQCFCGDASDTPLAITRYNATGCGVPNGGNQGSATPCNINIATPRLRDWVNGPWCGGHGLIEIYLIQPLQ